MKRKGFTLIELLAVIVILAIIALIAVPIVMNIIGKANKSAFKDTGYGILKAGELYYAEHLLEVNGMENDVEFKFPEMIGNLEIKGALPSGGNMIVSKEGKTAIAISNGKYCVRKGYTDNDVTIDEDIENCKTKEKVNFNEITNIELSETDIILNVGESKTITVTYEPLNATLKDIKWTSKDETVVTVTNKGEINGISKGTTKVTAETMDGSSIKREVNITVKQLNPNISSSNNCIKDSAICPNGTKVNVKVNSSENYDFYVIKDTGTDLTLIMDKNLGSRIAWITKEDYELAGGINYGSEGNNEKGPLTALKSLEQRTSGWINVPAMTYTLTDGGGENRYTPIIRNNVRSRMLTYTEATALGCKNGVAYSCSTYLYPNLSRDNTEVLHFGYWLSSAISSYSGMRVTFVGVTSSESVYNNSLYGIRPVITLSKHL